jgi:hypothetical protein
MQAQSAYLDQIKQGIDEVPGIVPALREAMAIGAEGAETRDGVIQTINEMCDALQHATDLIAKELSLSIMEFNQLHAAHEVELRAYFDTLTVRFSDTALRTLLHQGGVCGALHKLGDRFGTFSAPESFAGLGFWDNVKTFFKRSNKMKAVLDSLITGEQEYLRELSQFLNDVVSRAETAVAIAPGQEQELRRQGQDIVCLMREKREIIHSQVDAVRKAGDGAIRTLH